MKDERRYYELQHAIITAVVRDGPDVVVTFRNAMHRLPLLGRCRFIATMRLVDARRINSVDCQNASCPARLEPGWKVYMATFDGLSLSLTAFTTFMNTSGHVAHRIWCDAAELKLRFDPVGTFKSYYYPASYTSVEGEPPSSPPIEGQEGPVGI